MYIIYKSILHSFLGDFKVLIKSDIYRRILWLISWSLQDDQGSITSMLLHSERPKLPTILAFLSPIELRVPSSKKALFSEKGGWGAVV